MTTSVRTLKNTTARIKLLPVYDSQNKIEVTEGLWMDRYEYPNVKDALPRIGVDWFEADKLCKEMEKHFAQCSNGTTCTNGTERRYPTVKTQKGRCNDEGTQILKGNDDRLLHSIWDCRPHRKCMGVDQ